MALARKIKYLDYFDTIEYDFSGKGDFNMVTDLTKSIIIQDKSDISRYLKYDIADGERPDQVSNNLYGDPQYYWLLFLYNDSLRDGMEGWPLSNRQFDKMIEYEYDPFISICPEPKPESGLFGDNRYAEDYFFQDLYLNTKYFNDIHVWIKDAGDVYRKTDLKLSYYDVNRFSVIFKKGENNYITELGIDNKLVDFAYEQEALSTIYLEAADSELGQEWFNMISESPYPLLEDDGKTFVPFYFNIRLSHAFLRNAPYQYYNLVNDEPVSLSHYDVVFNAISDQEISLPSEITFIEYENILNERKKSIIVPRKEHLTDLKFQYRSLLGA